MPSGVRRRLPKKELVYFTDGYRESTQSWRELLADLKKRGLAETPALTVGDGDMGFFDYCDVSAAHNLKF